MLQSLLQELGHGVTTVSEPQPLLNILGEHPANDLDAAFADSNAILPPDTAAQWSAGLLYAWSGQTLDKRDYIVHCTNPSPYVNKELGQGYYEYA